MIQLGGLLFINVVLLFFGLFCLRTKISLPHWRDVVKHAGILEIAWGTFSTMFGLLIVFDILESVTENASFAMIAEGFNLVKLFVSFGFGMLHFFISSLLIYKVLRNTSH